MSAVRMARGARELMAMSRAQTRIDSVDSDIEEALQRMLTSLDSEAELTDAGARHMEQRLLLILCNRLRMFRDIARHPEIEHQPIVRPHFLTGAGRSGSTKLHKLLAASGDFKFLRFWEQYCPALLTGDRDEDPAPRIAEAEAFTRWFDAHAPDAKLIHAYETFEPEEETFLFDHARFAINFGITHVNVPSYMQWWAGQDIAAQLRFLKQTLQYLQWQFHDGDTRPWLLKNPIYCGLEPLLVQLFPDAVFVATQREPGARISSSAGLIACMQRACSNTDRSGVAGPIMLEYMAMAAEQYLAGREAHPEVGILDIGYPELTQQAEQVAEKIYACAGRPLTDDARQRMRDWDRDNRQHKHGVYRHTLADFGLTQAMVEAKFRRYRERFGQYY